MAHDGTKKRDALLAASLAAGATHEEAATAAGVSLRTVARRMADPEFCKLVDAQQDTLVERFVGGVVGKLGDTLNRLNQLVASQNEQVSLGACRAMIDALLRVRAHASHSRRMSAIEGEDNEEHRESPDSGGEEKGDPPDEPPHPDGSEEGPGGDSDAGGGDA